jgi:hypothetical protein
VKKSILVGAIITVGAIALIAKTYRVKEALDELRYKMLGLKVDKKSIHLTSMKGQVIIGVINDNLESLPLTKFDGTMTYAGRVVSDLRLVNPKQLIAANDITPVQLNFTLDNVATAMSVVQTLIALFSKDKEDDKSIDKEITLKGWLHAGGMKLKINNKFKLL